MGNILQVERREIQPESLCVDVHQWHRSPEGADINGTLLRGERTTIFQAGQQREAVADLPYIADTGRDDITAATRVICKVTCWYR